MFKVNNESTRTASMMDRLWFSVSRKQLSNGRLRSVKLSPKIAQHTCAYEGVRNDSFFENLAHALNE